MIVRHETGQYQYRFTMTFLRPHSQQWHGEHQTCRLSASTAFKQLQH
jgi:hypothetical protein